MAGINGSMAHLSDSIFTTSIAVYALAMVAYTAEYAFGRRGRIADTAVLAAPARELVGAGGTVLTKDTPSDIPSVVEIDPTTGKRSFADRAGWLAVALTVFGALLHTGSIAVRAIAVDAVPWSNMYEFASVAGLVGVVAFLGVLWKAPSIRHLGSFILLPVVLMMFLAGTVLYSKAQPLVPALQSYWLAIHVTLVSIAEGALMTSAVLTALYLVKVRHDRLSGKPGYVPGRVGTLASRLPAADVLDKTAYRIVAFAFPLYTVAIICGSIWAEAAWGRYWGWDPKETWAFIVWVIYACYLHARATAGFKGKGAAWVNLAGFGAITFNFLVVNIVVSGLHSYAGLS
ncbi:c-type cytochrome biogenesis protein CcsB [Jatrophihabitans sp.]|uniref:c-type cytochrome biogenesis protein CcsB n=1 Tax=Jatrophihabitans sp. TaxID=1932789 RepID=UPI0030C689AE|nr:Cytochrome c-type biosis protein CcsB [Jatrophihabitans sp.]